jgi:hypothetical protein
VLHDPIMRKDVATQGGREQNPRCDA